MFSNFILSRFIANYTDVSNIKVREAYGYLSGVIGIIVNLIISILEFIMGMLVNSIAITADAFHNLTDVAASVITIFGFRLASKPADEEHPFGHGRIEYLSAMLVSFIIILIGLEFIKSSFNRIIHPSPVIFNLISLIILLISIPLKIWLSKFNKKLGEAINSSAIKATGIDALNDVFILSAASLSLIFSRFTKLPIDGYIGIVVALFIIYSGYSLIKDTLNPLLGEAPDQELVHAIKKSLLEYEHIQGSHDLIIHNYGPGRCMATVHAEVPCDISIVKIHEVIDQAEKEISSNLGIVLIIHMDPINTDNEDINNTRNEVMEIIKTFPGVKSLHDFRVVGDGDKKNLIFDIVIGHGFKNTREGEDKLKLEIDKAVKTIYPHYNTSITIDVNYSSEI